MWSSWDFVFGWYGLLRTLFVFDCRIYALGFAVSFGVCRSLCWRCGSLINGLFTLVLGFACFAFLVCCLGFVVFCVDLVLICLFG